jgi:hypothetical protein
MNNEKAIREDLVLSYRALKKSLQEGVWFSGRRRDGKYYAVPEFERNFTKASRQEIARMLDTIKESWKEIYGLEPIPELELTIITSDQFALEDMGWDHFKRAQRIMQKVKNTLLKTFN